MKLNIKEGMILYYIEFKIKDTPDQIFESFPELCFDFHAEFFIP
ncbi:hypothetical protein [Chryseobacterium sp.]|jgi:hypothetical protein|nr:hypothetical protein [Chryseobacterium sp.]